MAAPGADLHLHNSYPWLILRPLIDTGSLKVHQTGHPCTDNDPAQRWMRPLIAEIAAGLPRLLACMAQPGESTRGKSPAKTV